MPAPGSAALERAVSQKGPPTAPMPAEGTSGKKETKDPPARKIKKGGKGEVLEEPAPGKKIPKRVKKKKTKADQPRDTSTAKEGGKVDQQVPYQGRWSW